MKTLKFAWEEIQKYLDSYFGSNENFEICFRDLLTFNSMGNKEYYINGNFDTSVATLDRIVLVLPTQT